MENGKKQNSRNFLFCLLPVKVRSSFIPADQLSTILYFGAYLAIVSPPNAKRAVSRILPCKMKSVMPLLLMSGSLLIKLLNMDGFDFYCWVTDLLELMKPSTFKYSFDFQYIWFLVHYCNSEFAGICAENQAVSPSWWYIHKCSSDY